MDKVIKKLEKNYGKGCLWYLGDSWSTVETLSSWSMSIDFILWWWFAKGRVVEVFWEEGSGKTLVSLMTIADAQKNGKTCAFIDMEHALDPVFAKMAGVNVNTLIFAKPEHWEEALGIVDELCKDGSVDLIVIDSVAALVPKAEVEWDMDDNHIGLHARMMAQGLRKITPSASKHWTTIVLINQTRTSIWWYRPTTTTTGGKSIKFFTSQRIKVRKKERNKEGQNILWYKMHIKVVKNKIGVPQKECEIDIVRWEWLDYIQDMCNLAMHLGIIERKGAYYTHWEITKQGKDAFVKECKENEILANEIKESILQLI